MSETVEVTGSVLNVVCNVIYEISLPCLGFNVLSKRIIICTRHL